MTPADLLRQAIDRAGGVTAFTKTFRYRVSPARQTVYDWLNGKYPIPPEALSVLAGQHHAHKPKGETP